MRATFAFFLFYPWGLRPLLIEKLYLWISESKPQTNWVMYSGSAVPWRHQLQFLSEAEEQTDQSVSVKLQSRSFPLIHPRHQRWQHVMLALCFIAAVPWWCLPQHPDLRSAKSAGTRKHNGAHSAVELGADLQLRVPHPSQQARRPLVQRPHAVPCFPVHPARLHQRDARPAGLQHLQVRSWRQLSERNVHDCWSV